MSSAEESAQHLARRLRSLRKQGWPGKRITQEQLGEAFDVSVPLISSWERTSNPVPPPEHRLEAYATFFATSRSTERRPYQVLTHLTEEEQAIRDSLLAELIDLRNRAQGEYHAGGAAAFTDNLWRFPPGEDITIVCSALPPKLLRQLPASHSDDPDYIELYQYSDLDSLFEIHGHIRAMNPDSTVYVRPGSDNLATDEYIGHLVLLGGVDWNQVTGEVLQRMSLPVQQQGRPDDTDTGGFDVVENGVVVRTFQAELRTIDGRRLLEQDVAHFYRSRNPFNKDRTVTICNGMYSRGVLGAARALSDTRFRDRNTAYVRSRFAGYDSFSIISRVQVLPGGAVVTPDWTDPEQLLHEWPA
ncbi:helix-turn-helix transcriptional regulator [Lentzea sp. NPDC042327]|uniref:helix-turn-helix domain-containing protein n=1 Tax=Lentzea sp. NPDC042327 TaxID=3154801 RepID=UPI003406D2EB